MTPHRDRLPCCLDAYTSASTPLLAGTQQPTHRSSTRCKIHGGAKDEFQVYLAQCYLLARLLNGARLLFVEMPLRQPVSGWLSSNMVVQPQQSQGLLQFFQVSMHIAMCSVYFEMQSNLILRLFLALFLLRIVIQSQQAGRKLHTLFLLSMQVERKKTTMDCSPSRLVCTSLCVRFMVKCS